jgi:hypothetical protein
MIQRLARSAAACAWFLCVVSCGDLHPRGLDDDFGSPPGPTEPEAGGQSGGEGSESCTIVEQPFEEAKSGSVRARDVLQMFEGLLRASPGLQWWPKVRDVEPIPPTRLVVTEFAFGQNVMTGCSQLSTSVEFDVSTDDGELAGHVAGTLSGFTIGEANLTLSAVLTDGALRAGPVRSDLTDGAEITLSLKWRAGDPAAISGSLDALGNTIAWINSGDLQYWYPTPTLPVVGPVVAVAPSGAAQQACEGLSTTTSVASFPSDEALMQSMSKRWIACNGNTNLENFAGIEIDGDGRWRQLDLVGGELVRAQGFGRAGQVVRYDGPQFNLVIYDWLPTRHAFFTAAISADGNTLRLDNHPDDPLAVTATFHSTDLPVRDLPAAYEAGKRAGQAACSTKPVDITSRPASISAVHELLIGSWTFCRGGFATKHAGVKFDEDGSYRYLEADGGMTAAGGNYEILDTSSANGPGSFQIDLTAPGISYPLVLPMFSNAPRMFLAGDDRDSLLSAM